jgi:hypothetical protein
MISGTSGRPIFVFGSPRSGTSLVSRILNAHPDIGVPYESLIYSTFYPIRSAYGALSHSVNADRLIRHILRWGPMTEWQPRVEVDDVRKRLDRRDFHGVFEAIMRAWSENQGKSRWGEKSPWHAFYWQAIREGFPDACVIHVVRDVRDATMSWRRARQGPRNPYVLARRWAAYIETMKHVRESVPADRYIELRYERLVADPESIVRELCEFLAEPYAASMLRFYEDDSPYPTDETNRINLNRPVLAGNAGKWREGLSARHIRCIEAAAAPQMRELGYAVASSNPRLGLVERLWILTVEHPLSRIDGMLRDRKGQREWLQRRWFPFSARCARVLQTLAGPPSRGKMT